MPCALALRLVPERDLPRELATGRAAHGLVFDLLTRANPALTARLHEMPIKPFTTAPLVNADGRRPRLFSGGAPTWLRVTLLEDELYPLLLASDLVGMRLHLGYVPVECAGWAVSLDGCPVETGATTYDALWSEAAEGATLAHLRFCTPTALSQGEADLPLPLPSKLWAGYAARWRLFARGYPLPEEFDVGAERWLRLVDFSLRPARWRYRFDDGKGAGRLVTHLGCVGWIEVVLDRRATPAFAQAFRALAAYSAYCGSGMKTTMGMGMTRSWIGRGKETRNERDDTPDDARSGSPAVGV